MAEISREKLNLIAFYLPQFHSIPENDEAYGKGFTEWTNTKKALPLFEDHYQPKVPLNENYYNLLDKGVMEQQSNMAQDYGVYGFCYYHYWFKDGKKLLEKPIENMLEDSSITIPFCLSWANENWSKRWDGGNQEIIMEQDYGTQDDWRKHLEYLVPFFKDSRYITINNKPLFLIYKPEQIPNLKKMIRFFRNEIKKYGFQDLYILVQFPYYYFNGNRRGLFDGFIEFEPQFIRNYEKERQKGAVQRNIRRILYFLHLDSVVSKIQENRKSRSGSEESSLSIRDYDKDWTTILKRKKVKKELVAGAFVDWDNTARNRNGLLYKGADPRKFGRYMLMLMRKVKKEYNIPIIFINAWNEWAEGAYLEPDEKNKYGYLEALKVALHKEGEM